MTMCIRPCEETGCSQEKPLSMRQGLPSASTTTFFTFSGSGGFRRAVSPVATSPPNSVRRQVVPTGCGPRGVLSLLEMGNDAAAQHAMSDPVRLV